MGLDKKQLAEKSLAETSMTVPPQFLGAELLMSPFANYISSQRLSMFGNHLAQFVPIAEPEFPRIFTGWENTFGKVGFSKDGRENDVIIQNVIPKHTVTPTGCKENNLNLVIATDCETSEIVVFEVNNYPDKDHKFAFEYTHPNGIPEVHSYLEKDTVLSKSSAWTTKGYSMGLNANVLFASFPETSEDATIISQELADKLAYSQIKEYEIHVAIGDIPLNRYGDVDEYKIFPEVGECVGEDGILMAIRKNADRLDISDVTVDALEVLQIHDDKYLAEPGSCIVDVTVDVPNKIFRECENDEFMQLNRYVEMSRRYYSKIVNTMTTLVDTNHTLSPMANIIMTEALCRMNESDIRNRAQLKLAHKNEQLDYYSIRLLVKTEHKIEVGNKVTGRHGEKGIIGAIWPTEDMPIDGHGIRSHIILPPDSPGNRLNPGQLNEQAILGCAEFICNKARNHELGGVKEMYKYFLGYIYDVAPQYASVVEEHSKLTQSEFVDTVLRDGFYIRIPPYSEKEYHNIYSMLEKKYGFVPTHCQFNITIDGSKKQIVSEDTVVIGGKYLYLMDSTPDKQITASSMGYISQFNTPVKAKSKRTKSMNLINTTPQRIGEDETSILSMMVGVNATSRLGQMYSHSPEGAEALAQTLLTVKKPSCIESVAITNEQLQAANSQTAIANHMLGVAGIKHLARKEGKVK